MRYRFYTADVFTDRVFGGNPLAVFPDAAGLDTATMQLLAREVNYSESTFVFPPETGAGTRRVRIFTPGVEMPFAGHPTVGTAFVLAAIGEIPLAGERTTVVLEENVGPVPVTIRAEHRGAGREPGWQPVFCQLSAALMPQFGPPPPVIGDLAAMLSLAPDDLLAGEYAPQAVSCGVPFLFVPLATREAVARARIRLDLWEALLKPYWASQVFVFSFGGEQPGSDVHARMFGPSFGIGEDPATGSAATALAGYLGVRDARQEGTLRWVAEQGFEMGRPSRLEIEADKTRGAITAIRVGGASVLVAEGTFDIPL
jgi:trans-2,3-dihydro-3-hydroxyanthranilate isomerase